ncbi:cobalt ECF transporter T component CbiQ [Magnetospirillum sp. 64-120]|uniref:cobalt ECF transporter T component CbiQ n=1 Tax=Magnetospirillum sp. 64-120 TaxID=1895778 RepID=UPI0025C0002B|nr:cobalt ECF transporter T component CbiQ [Magnetospirillum sp. 64-120]
MSTISLAPRAALKTPPRAALEMPLRVKPILSRLDPRSRVVACLAFAAVVVVCHSLPAAAAALLPAAVLALLAGLQAGPTLRRLLALEGFMILTLFTLPFTMGGPVLFSAGGLDWGLEGTLRAALILTKGTAIALSVMALLGTLELAELGHALARLRLPARFVALFVLAARYVDVLHTEYGRLRLAMRARGFRPRASLHCWCALGHLVGMLVVGSLERAERVHAAMRLRGFDGRLHLLDEHRPGRLDWGFAAVLTVTFVLLAVLDFA